ncbi:MAG: O-antigen ligase family protein [Terriglobales bacterium]
MPTLTRALGFGLIGLLIFGPLAFGAVESWSIFALEAGAIVLFLLWAARQWTEREVVLETSPLFGPLLAVAAIWFIQLGIGRSAYPYETLQEGFLYGCYALLVFLSAQYFRGEKRLKRLAVALSVFGFLFALFAVIQDFTGNDKIYWLRQPRSTAWIYGSYVNHNHYAGLIELLIPFPLILCMSRWFRDSRRLLFGFAAVVMGASIFMSLSRGGMVAFLVQLLFLAACVAFRKQKALVAILFGIVLVIGGLLFWLGQQSALGRLESLRDPMSRGVGASRIRVAQDCLRMWRDRPLLGWGLGTFVTVFPAYRSSPGSTVMNAAHNDYLEFLVETGALGLVALLWFLYRVYARGLASARLWNKGVSDAIRFAALLGCTGILTHGLVDFNLHIPANAAIFFVLAGIAASKPRNGNSAGEALETSERQGSWGGILKSVVLGR